MPRLPARGSIQPASELHNIPPTRLVEPEKNGFTYYPPGWGEIRQYELPDCKTISGKAVAKGLHAFVKVLTPYSNLVFAPPTIMRRFPIALAANQQAFANSQIFGPGGSHMVNRDAVGVRPDCKLSIDKSMGVFDDAGVFHPENYSMPWSDTFCEWRADNYTVPFCTKHGSKTIAGRYHFGVDIRAITNINNDTSPMNEELPIVSVSDGIVVEVGERGEDRGYVVKVRSEDLIFAYRHMKPESSPFRRQPSVDPEAELRLGDRVGAGQLLGYMGRYQGGPEGTTKHLHFEIEAPVPKAVEQSSACNLMDGNAICTAREKVPPYPSLIISYLGERYGISTPLTDIDKDTGRASLPRLKGHELSLPLGVTIIDTDSR